ncbi:MAG: hypothetical protein QOF74_6194 [Caballeronia mineralivorans]|jgi:hypothetical protein|nr:hypothetical protein [Caballeronia mineralivorans]
MTQRARDLYRSSNGDRWSLVHDLDSGRVFIRHEPNISSGGLTSETAVGDFLMCDAQGPEHAELLRLIGTLVDPG